MAKTNRNSKTRKTKTALRTQRDGRLFAIRFLCDLKNIGSDELCAIQKELSNGKLLVYRKSSQSDFVLRRFETIMRQGTREAVLGFFVVITDFLGHDSTTDPESYGKWERAGNLQYWRLPKGNGTEARHA